MEYEFKLEKQKELEKYQQENKGDYALRVYNH